ncbi:MAG TPA: hypothetical protein VI483_00885 [Candidatus Paceibacterota bacterium]
MDLQSYSSFLLVQKITFLVNRYQYFLYDNNVQGESVAFVEQKRFAFREHVTIWRSEEKHEAFFTVRAEKILDVHGKFLIEDTSGQLIGYCRKGFAASLLRSTWEVYDRSDALLFMAKEKSVGVALGRRVAQFIPILGDVAQIIPFNFILEKDGRIVGSDHRVWGSLNDRYALEASDELKYCDRRILLALGILLDALQDR